MAMWGRMPFPSIPISSAPNLCPQEPWKAQEDAHRDRSRVKFSFCVRELGGASALALGRELNPATVEYIQ